VVSELKKSLGSTGTDVASRFLRRHNLTGYLRDVICPQGRFNAISGSVDRKYKGETKTFKKEVMLGSLTKEAAGQAYS
jgi:hypothetical protein